MKRSSSTLALLPLVLAAGCALPTDDDPARNAPEARAASAAAAASPAPVSTVTPLPGGGFRFVSTAVLDAPEGAVWAKVHSIETLTEIALPGIASDFQWLDGGNPARVPSRYQFTALGATVREEVIFLDRAEKVLKYRLVTPALGIHSYAGTLSLDPVDNDHTLITFSRDVVFDDPAAVAGFTALFEQEIDLIQAYFADPSS